MLSVGLTFSRCKSLHDNIPFFQKIIIAGSYHQLAIVFIRFKFKILLAAILNTLDHFRHQFLEFLRVRVKSSHCFLLLITKHHLGWFLEVNTCSFPLINWRCLFFGNWNFHCLIMWLWVTTAWRQLGLEISIRGCVLAGCSVVIRSWPFSSFV